MAWAQRNVATATLTLLACATQAGATGSVSKLRGVPPPQAIRVDPASGHFIDEVGRVRIFHGVNVVYKQAPWYPPSDNFTTDDSLDRETMDLLRMWGFNVVRLGVMWPGVEPEPKKVDGAYLGEVARLAAELSQRGVYTIADLHQDVGSRHFCGEGFPEHYVDALLADPGSSLSKAAPFPSPMPFKLNVTSDYPLLEDCLKHEFAQYYLSERVGTLWKELYTPGTELHEGFLRFWSAVSKTFKHGAPHVLAYELLNEPSGFCLEGTTESCATELPGPLGNWVEARVLTPLYRAAAARIREEDPERPILYEATVLPKVGAPVFPEAVLGNDTQQGLAYHIYCAPGDAASETNALVCRATQDLFAHEYFSFIRDRRGVAGFMTEFGAIGGSPGELRHLSRLLGFADDELQSWAYWQLKKYGDITTANAAESLYNTNGKLEVDKLRALSRTYAQAIAGVPKRMSFDPDTALFELDFNATLSGTPTEIYLNHQLHYPHGHSLQLDPPGCLLEEIVEENYLFLTLDDAAPSCKNSLLKVRVDAKSPEKRTASVLV